MSLFQLEFFFLLFLPGFALTFLFAWHCSRHKPNFFKITLYAAFVGTGFAAIVCGGLVVTFFYLMGPSETDYYKTPLTVEQARQLNCPILLPNSARNVQFVCAYGGIAFENLVRFEAPAEVCKSQVQIVFDAWAKQTQRPLHSLPLIPLDYTPPPEDHDMVGRASWFDVDKIERGLKAGGGSDSSYNLQFWIDEDRGIFYCKITD